ncbi:MAG: hypothetical protein VCA55_03085, partial [Verrucomicrobiales bacterium]
MRKQIRTVVCACLGALCLSMLFSGCSIGVTETIEFPEEILKATNSPQKSPATTETFTHRIQSAGEQYYLNGPQQARAPDGSFAKGTRVKLIRTAGSYSLVQSESGITAYVTTG